MYIVQCVVCVQCVCVCVCVCVCSVYQWFLHRIKDERYYDSSPLPFLVAYSQILGQSIHEDELIHNLILMPTEIQIE